jgi:phage-related protein
MDSVYDFSAVASGGEIVYNQRNISVGFTLTSYSKAALHTTLTRVVEWIQDAPQGQLIFDDIIYYYFMAEVEDSIEINESLYVAKIAVNFTAEPFKTSINYVGATDWDSLNFDEDVLQESEFDVVVTETVSLYNPGRAVMPIVTSDAVMTIVFNSVTYNLAIGDNTFSGFKFATGANSVVINGTGHVEFLYRKVVI